jgi:8-oxo-dGTP diphosphatase
MTIGHFLGGVATLIYDRQTQRYLILRRSAKKDFAPDSWECVSGRVEQGESFEQAVHREVMEETGAQIQIEALIGTTHFYRGAQCPENELLGVGYSSLLKNQAEFTFGEEHSEMRWVTVEEAYALLPEGYWLRRLIERAELLRRLISSESIGLIGREGFEF